MTAITPESPGYGHHVALPPAMTSITALVRKTSTEARLRARSRYRRASSAKMHSADSVRLIRHEISAGDFTAEDLPRQHPSLNLIRTFVDLADLGVSVDRLNGARRVVVA